MPLPIFLLSAITGGYGEKFTSEKIKSLLTSKDHSPLLERRRALVILSRIRLMALLGAALYMLGSGIDYFNFDSTTVRSMIAYRASATILLLLLIFAIRKGETLNAAYRALAIFFAISVVFQGLFQPLILPQYMQSIHDLATAGYAIFPFLIVACISVFPLTAKEAFLLSVLFFTAELLILALMPDQVNPKPGLGILLSLICASALSSFSAVSQLSYMVSLVEQASIDALTDCYSRNSGEEILDVQFRIARRQKNHLSIIFLDLDDFKVVNDKFGHDAGDKVLACAAENLRHILRESDVLIRWGGEEFVMLLPHTDSHGAAKAIRRLQANGLGIKPDGHPLTASMGVAELLTSKTENWSDLIDLADEQMYLAKYAGKNGFSVHSANDKTVVA
ncbi:MAG: GGDEF domain-containing protein [Sneathiella sp.]|nr:GGDEF domain-containing protein [Sneathiella sp.]